MDIPALFDAIRESRATGKALKALLLTAIKRGESAIPPMPVRAELAPALSRAGVVALPELMSIAKDKNESDYVRRSALEALALVAPGDQSFENLLLDLLQTSTGGLLWHVVEHIGHYRARTAEAMLRKYLFSKDAILAADAFWALSRLTPSVPYTDLLGRLLAELESDDRHTQVHAIRSIGRLRLSEAMDALERFLADSNWQYRWVVPETLAQIGGSRATITLATLLSDSDPRVIAASLQGLSQLPGPIPARVERALGDLAESKELVPHLGVPLGKISQEARARILAPTMGGAAQVFICRHCRTLWNESGIVQGRKDLPLSPAGTTEAEGAAKGLLYLKLDRIISSPAKRALQTAQILADILQVPLDTHAGLLELDHGAWEGQHLLHLKEDESFVAWLRNPTALSIPGSAETVAEAVQRFRGAILDIASRHGRERILIVAHKHVTALFFAETLRRDLSTFGLMIVEDVEPRIIPPRIVE